MPEVMDDVLEENYMCEYILTLLKYIHSLVKSERWWFKEYIKTMTLKIGFKQCKTDPCLLYKVNELRTEIVIVYVDDTLTIRDKTALMDMVECIKK